MLSRPENSESKLTEHMPPADLLPPPIVQLAFYALFDCATRFTLRRCVRAGDNDFTRRTLRVGLVRADD